MTAADVHHFVILIWVLVGAGAALSILSAFASRQKSGTVPAFPSGLRLKLSPKNSAILIVVGVIWYAIDSWLEYKTGWRTQYGLNCFGRCSLTEELSHSFLLLHRGPYELFLFMMLWAGPAGFFGYALWVLRKYLTGEDSSDTDA